MSPCQEYEGLKNAKGYGQFHVRVNGKRTTEKAHRAAYRLHYGVSPVGKIVRHKCDNPSCVNPEHLELGTHQDNVNDRQARSRQAVGESHGRTKYLDVQVAELKRLFSEGKSRKEAAALTGISYKHALCIIAGGSRKTVVL